MTLYDWQLFEGQGQKYAAIAWGWSCIAVLQYELGGWWLSIDDLVRCPVMVSLNVMTKDDAFTQADQIYDYWITAEKVVEEAERNVLGRN